MKQDNLSNKPNKLGKVLAFFRQNPHWLLAIFFVICAFYLFDYVEDYKKPLQAWEKIKKIHSEDRIASLKNYMRFFLWLGSLCLAFILTILVITTNFWGKTKSIARSQKIFTPRRNNGFIWVFVLVVFVLALFVRLQRMNLSHWTDENWAFSNYVWGKLYDKNYAPSDKVLVKVKKNKPEKVERMNFQRYSWEHTLFWNKRSNNHILHSVFQRGLHDLWLKLFNKKPYEFSEWVLRIPALVFGMGAVLVLAVLFMLMGYGKAACFGVLLLVLHPSHLRYCTESRGYTLVLFFVFFSYWMLINALERGKWRYWVLFALAELLSLASFSPSVFHYILLNIIILCFIFFGKDGWNYKKSQFYRYLFVSLLAAGIYLQTMLPSLIQTVQISGISKMFSYQMFWQDYVNLWSEFIMGAQYFRTNLENPIELGIGSAFYSKFVLYFISVAIVLSVIYCLVRLGGWSIFYVVPFFSPIIFLIYLVATGKGMMVSAYFFTSFGIAIIILSLAFSILAGDLQKKFGLNKFLVILPFLVFFGIYASGYFRTSKIYLKHPLENLRRAAEVSRYVDPDAKVFSLWRSWECYDPQMDYRLRSGKILLEHVREAVANKKPLYAFVGHLDLSKQLNLDFLAVAYNEKLFEKLPTIWGKNNMTTIIPYRLKADVEPGNEILSDSYYGFK